MSSRTKLAAGLAVAVVIAVAIAAGAYLALSGGGNDKPPRPANGKYTNSKMRYSFEYPTDWKDVTDIVESKGVDQAKILDQVAVGNVEPRTGLLNGALLSVVRIDHTVKANDLSKELADMDEVFKQQAAAVSGKLQPPLTVELGGLPARQYVIEFVFGQGDQAASAQTVTFFGDRQYTVNCQGRASSFNQDVKPGCEKVLESFRFK